MSNSVHHLHCVTNWRPRLCVQKQWNQNFLHTCWVYHAEKSGIFFFFFTVAVSVLCSVMSNSLRPPWTVAHQAPLSMKFSRQEYWSKQPFPYPGDLPDWWTEPKSLKLQADSLLSEPLRKPLFTIPNSKLVTRKWWILIMHGDILLQTDLGKNSYAIT